MSKLSKVSNVLIIAFIALPCFLFPGVIYGEEPAVKTSDFTLQSGEVIDLMTCVTLPSDYDGEVSFGVYEGEGSGYIEGTYLTASSAGEMTVKCDLTETAAYDASTVFFSGEIYETGVDDVTAFSYLAGEGSGMIEKDGVIYLSSTASCTLTASYPYDSIEMNIDKKDGVSFEDGMIITKDADSGSISGTFDLYDSSEPLRRTGYLTDGAYVPNAIPDGYLYVDASAPDILYRDALYHPYEDYNFQFIMGNTDCGTFTIKDGGCGISRCAYAVMSGTGTEEEVRDAIKTGSLTFNELAATDKNVYIGDTESYVIVMMASDELGNAAYATSSGVLITADETDRVLLSEIIQNEIETDDMTYAVSVNNGGVRITSVEVALVTDAGTGSEETLRPTSRPEEENNYYFNAFTLSMSDLEDCTYQGQIFFRGRIEADKVNSDNTILTVTAYDEDGNAYTASHSYVVDTKGPDVTVSYDNDSAANGFYFNGARTCYVHIEEQDMDLDAMTLTVGKDGEEESVSLSSLTSLSKASASGITSWESEGREIRSAERWYEFSLSFTDDGDYTVSLTGQDKAGNKMGDVATSSEAPFRFVIDQTAPVLDVSYRDSSGNKVDPGTSSPCYSKADIHPTITFSDKFLSYGGSAGSVSVALSQKDANGNAISVCPESVIRGAENIASYETDGYTYTYTMAMEGEAAFGLSMTVTDLAGNTASYEAHYFTVDRTAPSAILVSSAGKTYSSLASSISFLEITNGSIAMNGSGSDDISGLSSIRYAIYRIPSDANGTFEAPSASSLSYAPYMGQIALTNEGQYAVYLVVEDRAGNATYINSEGIIIDRTAPGASITLDESGLSTHGIYKADVSYTVSAEDPASKDAWSGLSSIAYEVRADGNVTSSGSFPINGASDTVKVQTAVNSAIVSAVTNNSNNIVIAVSVTDRAGNKSDASKALSIDTSSPRIEVTYDNNDVANGKYYKDARTATVTIYERNFDASLVSMVITGSDGAYPSESSWTSSGSGDGTANTKTILYEDDAEYTFTIALTDEAGNAAAYGETDDFVIDRTAPKAVLVFDNNDVKNDRYYKEGRAATVTVAEKNFDSSLIETDIVGDPSSISAWRQNGDEHTETVSFMDDGTYSIEVRGQDLAGNAMEALTEPTFVIDTISPKITISDVEMGCAYRGDVAPYVVMEDDALDGEKTKVSVTGEKGGKLKTDKTGEAYEVTVEVEDPAIEIGMDDIYTLKAHAEDLAGNTEDETLIYSVNRYGSTYMLSDETKAYLNIYYEKDQSAVQIEEINVSPLTQTSASYGVDAASADLEEGNGYEVQKTEDGYKWQHYTYTFRESVLDKDGHYDITVASTDEAGNNQTNISKGMPVSFIYDTTSPILAISGIEDKEVTEDTSRDVGLSFADTVLLKDVSLTVNGEEVYTATEEEIEEGRKTVHISLKEGENTIVSSAKDMAGNEALKTYTVTVERKGAPLYLILPIGIGAAAALGIGGYLFVKKRREKN